MAVPEGRLWHNGGVRGLDRRWMRARRQPIVVMPSFERVVMPLLSLLLFLRVP